MRSVAVLTILAAVSTTYSNAQPSRIRTAVDNARRVTLTGHVRPFVNSQNDLGRIAPSVQLSHVTLMFSQSDAQKADLNQLLADQQNTASPLYHHWLTPEEYGARFGVSDADLAKINSWLQQQGLMVTGTGRGRNWISFDGTAAQVEAAFQTELHQYTADGETVYSNNSEPSIPAAFQPVVQAVHGLSDFRFKPARHSSLKPDYTSSKGNHYLAPDDFSTIYNVNPLYSAGFDGSGQKLVIVGQTQINLSDIDQFRTQFGLASNDPQVVFVPNTKNPGVSSNDLAEADLDLEWSGAVARNASIIYVYTYNVMDSVQYAIDQNLAPVISSSYGLCEAETGTSDAATLRSWARQGNAQGITWFAASGDNGAADCNDSTNNGLAVDVPAAIPEVTGVGGTEFSEGAGTYWNSSNDTNRASVLSYVPEVAWNDSAADGEPAATGGGASTFFTKPSWQTGTGVPSDNARHVPDVSLAASADHDGYLVYTGGSLQVFGGTSVPTPSFAGLITIFNQYLISKGMQSSAGLGNINPTLYSLAQTTSGAFHDITSGNNMVTATCPRRSITCSTTPIGFTTGVGYDSVTGLGSVDAFNLATAWTGGTITPTLPTSTLTLTASANSIAANGTVFLTATVTGTGGVTPTGSVTFSVAGVPLGSVALTGSGGSATATLSVAASSLAQGSSTVTAEYSGDSSINATIGVSVSSASTGSTPSISGIAHGASFKSVYAPGMILSVFGSQLAPSIGSAASIPLPLTMSGAAATVNGIAAPLYYVSPTQLNIQIPYEVVPGSNAVVSVNNNGQVASQSIAIAAAAPGIFTDSNGAPVPNASAAQGSTITLFITGAGAVSPQVATGAAPASTATPTQSVSVTVGGVAAAVVFDANPSGLVGVVQINYQVPTGIASGAQPVVVTVGGVPSSPAILTVY